MRRWILVLGVLSVSGFGLAQDPTAKPGQGSRRPNIVFVLADDMGYGDVQAYQPESKIPTPHLNRLAREGMVFTDAHTGSAVCTPTRYGLLTGRYCWRSRLKSGVLFPPQDRPLIEKSRLTVAGLLQQHGYHTACIGKWHLGIEWGRDGQGKVDFNQPFQFGPTDVGFDEFFGIAASLDMVPYGFLQNHEPVQEFTETQSALPFPRFIRSGPKAKDFHPGNVLDTLTQRAVDYIQKRAGENRPFFLYLAFTAPHKPVWPAERFLGKTDLGPYGDFVVQTDWSVGQVLQALDTAGVTTNTLLFFTSDNGSYMYRWPQEKPDHTQDASVQAYWPSRHQANAGWRGTKADIWEGGHRVPFLARWPGRIAGGTRCDETICLTDFMATCADLLDTPLPKGTAEDSFSLWPLLSGKGWSSPRPPVVHHSANGVFAIRSGNWKLVLGNGSGGREKPAGKPFQKPYALFDLRADPFETTNRIDQHPDLAKELEDQLNQIRTQGRSSTAARRARAVGK